MSAMCPVCQREQDAGLLCHACTSSIERELGDVAAIVGELDITLSKQARIGASSHGGKKPKGWDRERLPINVGAVEAADNLGNVLTTWARDVGKLSSILASRPAVAATHVLLTNIDAIRRHAAVVELVDEISDAITQARRAVDRPAERVFVGPCMVPTPDEEGRDVTCLADVYATPSANSARCKVCGSDHDVAERRVWLLEQARDRLFTVQQASQYIGEHGGMTVNQKTIRTWLDRKRLPTHPGPTDERYIRLGDLLELLTEKAAKAAAKAA